MQLLNLQFESNLCFEQNEMWDLATQNNWGTQIRGVMSRGLLSGKYFARNPEFASDDHRSIHCHSDDYTKYSALQDLLPEGMSMSQAAVRWVLEHDQAHTICMGAKNLTDYKTALAALDQPPLGPELSKALGLKARELHAQ